MEEASLHTTRKHLFISTQYYDKHGVPPTKRLFKVAMLDPSPEFIGHWGMFGDPGLPTVGFKHFPEMLFNLELKRRNRSLTLKTAVLILESLDILFVFSL
ncbi:hypothetical protein Tco_0721676 [Tanacetum coccineum]